MGWIHGSAIPWLVFVAAAVLEVGGDAVIRRGLRELNGWFLLGGCLMLAAYGLVVNLVKWDFSKLLGVYIAVFAIVSVLVSRLLLAERVAPATWAGLALIILGGLVIQVGRF